MISSRTLLLALAGLNLLVFLVLVGALPGTENDERDPARLERQIAPEKLERIRPSSEPISQLPGISPGNPASESGLPAVAQRQGGPIDLVPVDQANESFTAAQDAGVGVPGLSAAAGQLARSNTPVTDVGSVTTNTALTADLADHPSFGPSTANASGASESPPSQVRPADDSLTARVNCVLFPETDYLSARRQIEQFAPSLARTGLKRLDGGSYLVFLDPMASKEVAEQRRDELIASGLSTAQVITAGLLKNGVQLGLVRTAEAAESRRLALLEQGIEEARIGPLSVTTSRYRAQMWADTALIEQSVRPAARQANLTLEPCESGV
ncbi:MAG: hypothetical protein AB8C46_14140 [Burkholderiaceae bacterium]